MRNLELEIKETREFPFPSDKLTFLPKLELTLRRGTYCGQQYFVDILLPDNTRYVLDTFGSEEEARKTFKNKAHLLESGDYHILFNTQMRTAEITREEE